MDPPHLLHVLSLDLVTAEEPEQVQCEVASSSLLSLQENPAPAVLYGPVVLTVVTDKDTVQYLST